MKKFIYSLALLPIVFFVSCGDDYEESPVMPGIRMYESANTQNTYAMEPISTAFRLNVLLSEALSQEVDITDAAALGNVNVTFNNRSQNLKSIFFPYGSEIEVLDGVYTITCRTSDTDTYSRDGKYVIDTNNKLLTDLEFGDMWEISLETNNKDAFIYYYMGGSLVSVDPEPVQYTILAGTIPNAWSLNVSGYEGKYQGYTSNSLWNSDFTLERTSGTGPMTFATAHASVFEYMGEASGFMFDGTKMSYTIPVSYPLVCNPACGNEGNGFGYLVNSGKVTVKFTGEYNTSVYPADECTITWMEGPNDCTFMYNVSYNGHTETY